MLPTYPRFAKAAGEAMNRRFRAVHNSHLGPMQGMQRIIHHEGLRGRFVDKGDDDAVVVTPVEHSVSTSITFDEVMHGDFSALVAKLDGAAAEMAGSSMRLLLQRMDEAVEKTGNKLDMRGQPLTVDSILKMLAMVQIDFTQAGEPILPSMLVHPDMVPKLKKLEEESKADPTFERRRSEIIEKQREAWRAREADRRLVG